MNTGGVNIDRRIDQAVRFIGLFVPALLLIYGVLIEYGVMPSSNYAGYFVLLGVTVPGILLAASQFLFWSRDDKRLLVYIVLFHIYAGAYVLGVSGFNSPFSSAWILLQLVTFAYFGMRGFRISLMAFFVIALLDAALLAINSAPLALSLAAILSGVLVVMVSSVIVTIVTRYQKPAVLPAASDSDESLQTDRLLTIVNNMADGFFSVDYNGRILLYNAAALDLLDTNQTLTGRDIQEVLQLTTGDDSPMDIVEILQKSRGLTIRDDVLMPTEDENRRIEITYSPVRSNDASADSRQQATDYIILLRDVTKEKSLSEERDEFISVVSHELRTPLTIAEGTISNLQLMSKQPKVKQSALTASIDQAHDQVMFLSKMVNDLSTLSRAERGVGDEPERIEVRPLVHELFNEYSPQADERMLTLDLDLSAHLGHVTASRLYLKELLQNFLSNALKYTKEGGIVLHVNRSGEMISFAVEDTGIGISKPDQKKIFERFYRSEDYRTRETGGTGLGLYVANKLARKLGTTIELKSRLNYGSTFSFELPIEK